MKEYTLEEILYKAAAYCSLAEHCESEVRLKLTAWGMPEEQLQDTIIDYLYQENYLSEERYCKAFVHDKVLYQGWGRVKIKAALQAKRLPAKQIDAALATIEEEPYLQILADLLRKKKRSLQGEEPEMLRMKLLRFAASRGFLYNEIDKALDME